MAVKWVVAKVAKWGLTLVVVKVALMAERKVGNLVGLMAAKSAETTAVMLAYLWVGRMVDEKVALKVGLKVALTVEK